MRSYYELHAIEGHEIQDCTEFRDLVQNLMDNQELEFFEEIKGLEGEDVCVSEKGSPEKIYKNYDCNMMMGGGENSIGTSEGVQDITSRATTQTTSSHISVSLVSKLKTHRNTLMKVLNETYVNDNISVNKLDHLVNNISGKSFTFFNDDEISPGDMGSTKALHITTCCKGYTLPGVLIDNGFALNVLPLSTLNRLPVDISHMKACHNIVRAFDGTKRKVIGRIEIPLLIGLNTYEVDFLVMDIKLTYNCLLGRLWIHSTGAMLSSMHQKLKLVTDDQLFTINAKEDIIVSVTNDAPYVGADEEVIECSFPSLELSIQLSLLKEARSQHQKFSKS
ncbi:hypothetical protein EPI10_020774 [Gossypium australe]|uniref:Uncharacterized protein n=1 Tax=Gossypium australe TaxID=47621 RepID=A0A5B6WHI8_9ROSI|nr:hypothetical protein EPI10_020774 [Gossypium australe]